MCFSNILLETHTIEQLTNTPHPLLEPPDARVLSKGLSTGPDQHVQLLAEKHRFSQLPFPKM